MKNALFSPADILLPKDNFEKWSVIACDQFTSKPEYWEEVKRTAGTYPSAINLIYPEAWLETTDSDEMINKINSCMDKYLSENVYNEYKDSFIYVERIQNDGRVRAGIVGKVDLVQYDYNPGSVSRVRATEKTVLERIPPRMKIRRNASTELPHVLMLIDDPEKTVIESIGEMKKAGKLKKLYDFTLMLGGGSISGWLIPQEYNDMVSDAVEALGNKNGGITMAVGDGNHSLASAKACYEESPSDISRYALVEVMNLHSPALDFESIYRTVTNVDPADIYTSFLSFLRREGAIIKEENGEQKVIVLSKENEKTVFFDNPPHVLPVGTLQLFLDEYVTSHAGVKIDYIHGTSDVREIAEKENSVGFLYDGITKEELFPAVAKEGVLPRKTFSMGTSRDKRYYTEARKIK